MLEVPADYKIGIVPASDTGAVEMALWSLLGARPVATIAWESFGEGWVSDIVKELKLKDVTKLHAGYGDLPDLSKVDQASDIVFTWNGTTSGVRVPNADWISADRQGLTICDATSAAFAQPLDFAKLDVVTFSWQKALGGEAAHGMLILSPRAVEQLEEHQAGLAAAEDFPPDQGRQAQPGHLRRRDHQHAVDAVRRGLSRCAELGEIDRRPQGADRARQHQHQGAVGLEGEDAVDRLPGQGSRRFRSNTSVCLKFTDPAITSLTADAQADFSKKLRDLVEKEGAGYDFAYYRDAPAGLGIWCGATVEASDVALLTQWIDWAFAETKAALPKAA